MKIPRRRVDGVLLLDKPPGLSSNAALQRVKRLYAAEKAGHSGTLDPLATGLLPILLGEATKFGIALLDSDKTYVADILLGVRTSTGDAEGEVLETRPVSCNAVAIESAAAAFRGEILQIPPMYSALKRDGRPLYEYARAGVEVDREPRRVVIHELRIAAVEPPLVRVGVRCSKGTYIRSLAEDLGAALDCGAHLRALRRIGVGPFSIEEATSLAALEELESPDRDALLRPLEWLLRDLPPLELDAAQSRRFLQGQRLTGPWQLQGRARIVGDGQQLLGTGEVRSDGVLHPARLLRH
jgi:tRNA pseudouridine55 synthase